MNISGVLRTLEKGGSFLQFKCHSLLISVRLLNVHQFILHVLRLLCCLSYNYSILLLQRPASKTELFAISFVLNSFQSP